MPIYLCNYGEGKVEPWKHHVHVYATPFDVDATSTQSDPIDNFAATSVSSPNQNNQTELHQNTFSRTEGSGTMVEAYTSFRQLTEDTRARQIVVAASTTPSLSTAIGTATVESPNSIRRIRHAEIVLVDDVCVSFDHYWLRLRWPGHKGGFAGYIDMGSISNFKTTKDESDELQKATSDIDFSKLSSASGGSESNALHEDTDPDDPARDDNIATPPSEPYDLDTMNNKLTCNRTGLAFPSSVPLKLLDLYDDGITPKVTLEPFPTEQIFCRICREGLHEDADTEQPNAATEDADNTTNTLRDAETPYPNDDTIDDNDESSSIKVSEPYAIGPVLPYPTYTHNNDAVQNPFLAPCECSGSMAFVHYMCVEQWRCRSRHPNARNGLNCETCGKPYALPPPSERQGVQLEHEDWLDAMPPHVMQALRQPHIWWQFGAAIVRRRWLRPLAPIFMSPVVALYCRARRLLKKRGVARRRWACSLCRRRARWKCVRCLRSYYCSRQCQNVSWHIMHKHVCYKPARFWWSVVVYGAIALLLFPGILRDPFMYDLGVCIIPISFIIMAVLGGGIASIVKRVSGVDIRGRLLELVAVVSTLWLAIISWGLIRGFFGKTSHCYGSFGLTHNVTVESIATSYSVIRPFRWAVLQPAEKLYLFWDRLILKTVWLRIVFCRKYVKNGIDTGLNGCFEHTHHANADFILMNMTQASKQDELYLGDNGNNNKCAADLTIVLCLYILAGVAFAGSTLLKHQERQRRRQMRHQHQHNIQNMIVVQLRGALLPPLPQNGGVRPHQD